MFTTFFSGPQRGFILFIELVKLGIINTIQQNALRNALLRGDADALKALAEFETTRNTVAITRTYSSFSFSK